MTERVYKVEDCLATFQPEKYNRNCSLCSTIQNPVPAKFATKPDGAYAYCEQCAIRLGRAEIKAWEFGEPYGRIGHMNNNENVFNAKESCSVTEATQDVLDMAQGILTALNTGRVDKGSLLHTTLRESVRRYRDAVEREKSIEILQNQDDPIQISSRHIWVVCLLLQNNNGASVKQTQTISWRENVSEAEAIGQAIIFASKSKPEFACVMHTTTLIELK